MRGRDHPHVHLARHQRPHPQHFLVLQRAQQFRLRAERHVADLVKENHAFVGELEQPHLVLRGARKSASHMAEQLALEQRLHHRRTVHHHEPPVPHRAEIVDRPGSQFLAGPGLARHQHSAEMRRDAADAARTSPTSRRSRPIIPSNCALSPGSDSQRRGFLPQPRFGDQFRDPLAQRGDRNRLIKIVRRPSPNRFHGRFAGVVRRHQNHVDGRIELHNTFQHFEAAEPRHHQIRQHDLRVLAEDRFDPLFGIRSRDDAHAFARQRRGEQFQTAFDYRR